MWREWRPVKVMPGWEVILHETWREAIEVVWWRWLVERRWLLVWGEGPPEVWGPLHAERWLSLAPGWLIRLVVPGWLVKLSTPWGWRLVLATPWASWTSRATISRATPARLSLIPHTLMAVPGWARRRSLSGVKRWLRKGVIACSSVQRNRWAIN